MIQEISFDPLTPGELKWNVRIEPNERNIKFQPIFERNMDARAYSLQSFDLVLSQWSLQYPQGPWLTVTKIKQMLVVGKQQLCQIGYKDDNDD